MIGSFMLAWLCAEEQGRSGGERGHRALWAVGGLSQAAAAVR